MVSAYDLDKGVDYYFEKDGVKKKISAHRLLDMMQEDFMRMDIGFGKNFMKEFFPSPHTENLIDPYGMPSIQAVELMKGYAPVFFQKNFELDYLFLPLDLYVLHKEMGMLEQGSAFLDEAICLIDGLTESFVSDERPVSFKKVASKFKGSPVSFLIKPFNHYINAKNATLVLRTLLGTLKGVLLFEKQGIEKSDELLDRLIESRCPFIDYVTNLKMALHYFSGDFSPVIRFCCSPDSVSLPLKKLLLDNPPEISDKIIAGQYSDFRLIDELQDIYAENRSGKDVSDSVASFAAEKVPMIKHPRMQMLAKALISLTKKDLQQSYLLLKSALETAGKPAFWELSALLDLYRLGYEAGGGTSSLNAMNRIMSTLNSECPSAETYLLTIEFLSEFNIADDTIKEFINTRNFYWELSNSREYKDRLGLTIEIRKS